MSKPKFELKSADSVRRDDKILVYGTYMRVHRVVHVNRHPIQLYEFHIEDMDICLRVPAGWQIKVLKTI